LAEGSAPPAGRKAALELPGYQGDRVEMVALVPAARSGDEVRRPDDLLRPGKSVAVAGGRAEVTLSTAPVLLYDPDVPAAPAGPDSESPFCLAGAEPGPFVAYAKVADRLKDLRISMVRGAGMGSARLSFWLERGVGGLATTDSAVRQGQAAGCDVVLLVTAMTGAPPSSPGGAGPSRPPAAGRPQLPRAPGRPGGGLPNGQMLPDLGKWRTFARVVAERYDCDGVDDMPGLVRPVAGYVIHTEPDFPLYWGDTGANYGLLAAEAAKAIKEAAPDARVVFAGTAGTVESYLRAGEKAPPGAPHLPLARARAGIDEDGMLLAGAKRAAQDLPRDRRMIDVMEFHFYEGADQWKHFATFAEYVRRAAKDAGWNPVEIWCTETGTWGPALGEAGRPIDRPVQTERDQACSLVKRYLYGRAVGVSRTWWLGLLLDQPTEFGQKAFDDMALVVRGRPRLAYYAFRTMSHLLGGCEWDRTRVVRNGEEGIYLLEFSRGGRKLWVAWAE